MSRRIILDSSYPPVFQPETLFPFEQKRRSLAPPASAKSWCQGHAYSTKCLKSGIQEMQLCLHFLGAVSTAAALGLGALSLLLSLWWSQPASLSSVSSEPEPGAWMLGRVWKEEGRVSTHCRDGLFWYWAGVWHWDHFCYLWCCSVAPALLFPWRGKGVFLIKIEEALGCWPALTLPSLIYDLMILWKITSFNLNNNTTTWLGFPPFDIWLNWRPGR